MNKTLIILFAVFACWFIIIFVKNKEAFNKKSTNSDLKSAVNIPDGVKDYQDKYYNKYLYDKYGITDSSKLNNKNIKVNLTDDLKEVEKSLKINLNGDTN